MALGLYFFVLAALMPYLYYRAAVDWNSPCVRPQANWIGGPIAAFTVPTASFLYDVLACKQPSLKFYVIRSLLEIALVPMWAFVWAWIELLILGWAWI